MITVETSVYFAPNDGDHVSPYFAILGEDPLIIIRPSSDSDQPVVLLEVVVSALGDDLSVLRKTIQALNDVLENQDDSSEESVSDA